MERKKETRNQVTNGNGEQGDMADWQINVVGNLALWGEGVKLGPYITE